MDRHFIPRIGITLGDPSGIGPEITAMALKALLSGPAAGGTPDFIPIVFGDIGLWQRACGITGTEDRLARFCADVPVASIDRPALVQSTRPLDLARIAFGRPTSEGGKAQLDFLEAAAGALKSGAIDGLCTAPVSKEAIHLHRADFQGHTEFLQAAFGLPRVLMLLAGPVLRVAIHTRHLAIADVPQSLSREGILRDLTLLDGEVRSLLRRQPRIAVLALNPHAGEGGLFGDEESRIIAPAVEAARGEGIDASGPFAADGFFAREVRSPQFDAVLAMFHDQGLIALKMTHFDDGVNVTVGLPRPRTSPDHGVAYDLAGTGRASPKSMEAALAWLLRRLR